MIRSLLALPAALVFAFAYASCALAWALLLPRTFEPRKERVIRAWGRWLMKILGLRLEIQGETLPEGGARILMVNHVNLLDLLVFTAIWPDRGTVVYKKEFHRIPVIGRAMRVLEMIPIDRSDRAAGMASLAEAAARIRDRGQTVLIAPEGTRSRDGRLLPFKKGPFHLALATRVPVQVAVMLDNAERMRPGTWLVRPGPLRLRYLPPIPTEEWREETLAQHIAEVRARFLAAGLVERRESGQDGWTLPR